MKYRTQWTNLVFFASLLSVIASLLLYAYLGTFTRYMADDYCTAGALKTNGFWGTQIYWWENWSGRYSFTFIVSLLELLGLRIVPILPAVIISLWLLSIVWACLPFLKGLQIQKIYFISAFVACLLLWLTYQSVSDYPQIVFWQTGILTYPVFPILFFWGVGVVLRRAINPAPINWRELLAWFLFALLMGGFSETGVVTQIVLLGLLLIFVEATKNTQRKIFTPVLSAALCGSLLSLLIIVLAPGNAVRSQGFKDIPPLGGSLLGSLVASFAFIPKLINNHTAIMVFGFLCGVFCFFYFLVDKVRASNLLILKHGIASFIVVEAGIGAGIAPAYILRGGVPPERVLLFSFFLVACLTVYWGMLAGLLLRTNLPSLTYVLGTWILPGLLIFLIVWRIMPVMSSQLDLISPLQKYSTVWDERHKSLVAASHNNLSTAVVQDIMRIAELRKLRTKLWITGDLENDPGYWVNRCASEYYEVNQIIANR